jgi:hypothetical protein
MEQKRHLKALKCDLPLRDGALEGCVIVTVFVFCCMEFVMWYIELRVFNICKILLILQIWKAVKLNYYNLDRPPMWSSHKSSWLQIQRSRFDSWHYQIFWEVLGLKQGPLSLVSTIEEQVTLEIRQRLN